ncbi:ROK family transcriptional regulator [Crossiella sp. SN42]|uniref:ROK family transcriptional regulator n=1 Tax=Crossiella sp. SN42 TaxID=2944808 RepID=UPI00207CEF4B|nr:ROK family transcriptional regulator [Crossiella sp. SN42]MCO1582514.1 ROK family transcriptional regulator [Crossiella sp. SN42]
MSEPSTPRPPASGANLRALRGHNSTLVLDLIRGTEGLSRVEIAQRTGLTAQAVSKIVARLIEEGLVAESGQAAPTVGKPRTLLRLLPEARFALGAHVDRDELRFVLVDLAGAVLDRRRVPMPAVPTPDVVIPLLAQHALGMVSGGAVPQGKLLGLGIGCPGPLDHHTGVVHQATHLPGWVDVPLRDRVAAMTGLPVILDKDTNTAIVAEGWRTEGLSEAALVYIGTGIGAGLVLNGVVHRGSRTNAGEFGHTTLQATGPHCACGRRGCVEVLCSPATVLARVRRRRGTGGPPSPINPEVLPEFQQLCADAAAGDRVARAELTRAARLLGGAVADLVNLLDIDQVVLAGRAVETAREYYVREIERALRTQIRSPEWQPVRVTVSDLEQDLVAAGAAMLLLSTFYGRQQLGQARSG